MEIINKDFVQFVMEIVKHALVTLKINAIVVKILSF